MLPFARVAIFVAALVGSHTLFGSPPTSPQPTSPRPAPQLASPDEPLAPSADDTLEPAPTTSVAPYLRLWDRDTLMRDAQLHAAPGGLRVLRAAQTMVDQSEVVQGSCYDWLHTVFERATGTWTDAFRGRIEHGPYAQRSDFQPGDWVLFINETRGGDTSHTHSAIFVAWTEQSEHDALMISYAGEQRDEPGRYRTYELARAYRVVRMVDEVPAPRARRHRGSSRRHD